MIELIEKVLYSIIDEGVWAVLHNSKLQFIISFLYFCILGLLITVAVKYLLSPLIPFITAFIIVSLSRKFIIPIEEKFHSKKAVAIIFTLLFACAMSLIIYGIVYGLFTELYRLSFHINENNLYDIAMRFSEILSDIFSFLKNNSLFRAVSSFFKSTFLSSDFSIRGIITELVPKILSFTMKFLSFFPSAVIFICIMFISMFYIGCDYEKICSFLLLQIPENARETFNEIKNIFISTSKELFKSYFLLTFITFLQLLTGFVIIGVDYALLIAAVVCLVDLIPILGTGTILIPWAGISFLFEDYKSAAGLAVLYAATAVFRQIAEPKIVGSNTGLSPLISLISIFVGLKLMGFAGIIVFPIIATTVIRLNEKGYIKLYKNFPEKSNEKIRKSKMKFLNFKRSDK